MITKMNHTGFVVKDLDRSVAFYRDIVGLKVVATRERQGGPISQIVGYENAHLKIAILGVEDGHLLELIQYVNPPNSSRLSRQRNGLGATHLAFNVDDIAKTYQQLISNGAKKLNPPTEIVPGRKGCYMQDPDGNWIELLEVKE
jgi:catechol 2,3-dioxygenase-like lactoylglutathione lyase family enzyme